MKQIFTVKYYFCLCASCACWECQQCFFLFTRPPCIEHRSWLKHQSLVNHACQVSIYIKNLRLKICHRWSAIFLIFIFAISHLICDWHEAINYSNLNWISFMSFMCFLGLPASEILTGGMQNDNKSEIVSAAIRRSDSTGAIAWSYVHNAHVWL